MIRAGTDKMTAEAVFDVPTTMRVQLDALGVQIEEGELIVKREMAASGRGRVLINGSPLSVRELSQTMDAALDIHGQHEEHGRVAGQTFRELLDEYGNHGELLESTRAAYRVWRETADRLRELSEAQRDRALKLDLLKYQIDEISGARLDPTEEESLRSEKAILGHAREMIESTAGAFNLLDDDENSALTQMARAAHMLQPLTRDIAELKQLSDDLQEITFRLQDVARTLSHLSESVRHDPARLEEVAERLVTVERLKKKYGGTVEAVLEHLSRITDEHEQLADYEGSLEKLEKAEATRLADYRKLAQKLSASRRKAAESFQGEIQAELRDLAMERTAVHIDIETNPDRAAADGFDRVDILIAPNRGEDPKPMQRIASGGELSRIQLAIAAALFKRSSRSAAATLVFDEIDAGIGGRVAEVVGKKLKELARANQVICVTHLPQIACFASTHFYVWKEDVKGQTRARIRRLDDDEQRVSEVARMLGGEKVPASAVLHARELLESARGKTAKARA
jgi:DNA repair protein RecN (Recombination protein N)